MVPPCGWSGFGSPKQIIGGGRVVQILQSELRERGQRKNMMGRDLHGLFPVDLGFLEILHLCVIHPPQIADVRVRRRRVRNFLQVPAGLFGFICAKFLERLGYFLFRVGRKNGRAGGNGSSGRGGFGSQRDGKLLVVSRGHDLHVLSQALISGGNDLQGVACGSQACKFRGAATENSNTGGGA